MAAHMLSGQCLCGKVSVTAEAKTGTFHACHCDICRVWGGGPALAFQADDTLRITGEDNVTVYSSSDWAERGFCKTCGTHLFYRLKENGHCYPPLGLFNGTHGMTLHAQSFIDKKHPGYSFAEQTENLTAAEFYAQFAE
ncbi:MAG: GFA family protein [Bdellovibrionales bacterium]|jgi:hypothetical protein|nr:GFA family protein [Bdellovibrionales bacterium]